MAKQVLADQLGKGKNTVTVDTDREAGKILMLWKQGYRVAVPSQPQAVSEPAPVTDLTLTEEPKPKRKKGS